jgi:membrane protein implicated in regulation of membrane protease activity
MQSPKTVSSKKLLNVSSLAALVAGGSIALLPLDSLTEQVIGIAIAFVLLSAANNLIKGIK